MRRLLVALILLAGLPARAQEDHPHRLASFGPGTFAFLEVARTTDREALEQIGKPAAEYDLRSIAGDIDLTFSRPSDSDLADRARIAGRSVITLRVMEWKGETGGEAKLVFRGGKLWYALLPITPSESTGSRVSARYGKDPTLITQQRSTPEGVRSVALYAYPDRGVAYLKGEKAGPDAPFSAKAIFPPGTRL